MIILFVAVEFLCGSLMFSYWIGLAAGKDLKTIGDGNPGAFNLWHAVGFRLGIIGVFLDFIKGYLPLLVFAEMGYIKGWTLVISAAAPIIGHAFSPFMKFKGGKGIAVTFGVWSAVTGFKVSVAYAVILAVLLIIAKLSTRGKPTSSEFDAFMAVIGMCMLFIYLGIGTYPEYIIVLWLVNLSLLVYTNSKKLYKLFKTALIRYKWRISK